MNTIKKSQNIVRLQFATVFPKNRVKIQTSGIPSEKVKHNIEASRWKIFYGRPCLHQNQIRLKK